MPRLACRNFDLRVTAVGIELWSADKRRRAFKYTSMSGWVKVQGGFKVRQNASKCVTIFNSIALNPPGFKIRTLGEGGRHDKELTYTTKHGEAIGRSMVKQVEQAPKTHLLPLAAPTAFYSIGNMNCECGDRRPSALSSGSRRRDDK